MDSETLNMKELLKISKHLTVDFISEKLTAWFGEEVRFGSYQFGQAFVGGLSNVVRVEFCGRAESSERRVSVRVIVKSLPDSVANRKTFRSCDFFKNEILFYQRVLPALRDFESGKSAAAPRWCARLFAAVTDTTDDFVALEDLSTEGEFVRPKISCLDANHAKVALAALADFHAASFAYRDQHSDKFQRLTKTLFETYYDKRYFGWYERHWRNLCECLVEAVRELGGEYSDKIERFAREDTLAEMARVLKETSWSGAFSHGDLNASNLLFRYKKYSAGRNPEEARIVDFQMARCASPAFDVASFVYSATDLTDYRLLLEHYHRALSSRISELGSDPAVLYPRSTFLQEIEQYSFFAIAFSLHSILEPSEIAALQGTEAVDIADVYDVKPLAKQRPERARIVAIVKHAVDNSYI